MKLNLMIMSGVEDGSTLLLNSDKDDGKLDEQRWTLTIGRRDVNDIILRNDTFVSRQHAKLHWQDNTWWLEDLKSTNGTFTENVDDLFKDTRIKGSVPLQLDYLFRVGRTWLRIQMAE